MFTPNEDQEGLRALLREFFLERTDESAVRETIDSELGDDPKAWQALAGELGVLGLAVPEDFGGGGYTFAEACLVIEEAGRAVACAPILSTLGVSINLVLLGADHTVARRILNDVVAGNARIATGLPGQGHDVVAIQEGDKWLLTGSSSGVLDASAADLLLIAAESAGETRVFEIPPDAQGVLRTPLRGLDLTRRSANLTFDRTPAQPISAAPLTEEIFSRVRDLATVALACEQVGGAQRALDASVAFAKSRVQFGRAIGSFQAVKHHLADLLVTVETARSAAYEAVDVAMTGSPHELAIASSVAGSYCSEAFAQVAEETIQIHGGIGFTWEHPAHLWFRRAKADVILWGSPSTHRARLSQLIP